MAAAVLPGAVNEPRPDAATRPNIIVFLADDLGYGDLGAYGGTDIPTPHIDALARSGVRFTNGYVTCPVCAPSRAGFLTGRYQQRFGFEHNPGGDVWNSAVFGVPSTEPMVSERLDAAGYATALFGKWHVGHREELQPHRRGFDEHFGFLGGMHRYRPAEGGQGTGGSLIRNGVPVREPEYLTDALAREAVDFIGRHADEPYFVFLSFNAVHTPMDATEETLARFGHIADEKRRTYAGMLTSLDDAVGRVLAAVDAAGDTDNTVVFFFSDNGGPTAVNGATNGPLRGVKGQLLEGGIRVPFLLAWPGGGVPAGTVYEEPVIALDVTATALAAAGLPTTDGTTAGAPRPGLLEGRNLLPFVTASGETADRPHEALFWRFGDQWAVRHGAWKLVVSTRDGPLGPAEPTPRLFNLHDDIGEANDLAAALPDKVAELRAVYAAWNAANVAPLWDRASARRSAD